MSERNRGRDFLFSNDCGFIDGEDGDSYRYSDGSGYYRGSDGSEGYIYSDGSGYYHGVDGSDGYIYSDGSAYYHGADGSDGYKYSDGSGYYHGADGSDGHRYSDGSGYYNSVDGTSYSFDPSDEDDDYETDYSDENFPDLASGLVGFALGIGLSAVVNHISEAKEEAQLEEIKRLERQRLGEEQKRIRQAKKEKERKQRNKRIKALLFNKKNLTLEFSISDCIGENVYSVIEKIEEAGFNNFKTEGIKDIFIGSDNYVGEVEQVIINGQSCLQKGIMVPYNAEIIIRFHVKREFEFPYSNRQMIKRDFVELSKELTHIGFTDVCTLPLNNLKTGWMKKDGAVKRVMIEGLNTIKRGMSIEYDKKITIQYHSFKKHQLQQSDADC
ncbi:hypothetical protein [Streptococcus ferus]|uniref:hypothetical protein n=1 Tax=Streptococcus ferus TaxID=1345 RepID=UPI0035A1487A